MTKEEIISCAKAGNMPTGKIDYPELLLFYMLRDIYAGYRRGIISAEKGEVLKNDAVKQFELNMQQLQFAREVLRSNAKMWQRTEEARSNYRLDRTLENADALVEAWDGAKARKDVIENG